MNRTTALDYATLISIEIVLGLDGGEETIVKNGRLSCEGVVLISG